MKPRKPNTKTIINIVLTVIVLWIVFAPGLMSFVMVGDHNIMRHVTGSLRMSGPMVGLFLLNYFFLCPMCLFTKGRKKWFYIINAVLILGWRAFRVIHLRAPIPPEAFEFFSKFNFHFAIVYRSLLNVALSCLAVSVAVGIRYIFRMQDMAYQYEVQKRNAAEAELSWLKNQLNPHFLFNTLNNISSLAIIDGDKAQDSIAQLSSLLRYVLYESDKDMVPLASELNFMKDYIDLMTLRCNSKTQVNVDLSCPTGNAEIAPLLFISLVENAFKHGVNSRMDSFVDISMKADGKDLVFECSNSLFEKPKTDMAGSGIGIQNMNKRLELIYPGRYEFEYGPQEDRYSSVLRIKDMFQ